MKLGNFVAGHLAVTVNENYPMQGNYFSIGGATKFLGDAKFQ